MKIMDFTTLSVANTINGWAVGIIRYTKSNTFGVVRINTKNQFSVYSDHDTETQARDAANIFWMKETGRGADITKTGCECGMIHGGTC